jgi:hypothetical protein
MCSIHDLICVGCDACNNSVELVFSNKYFEENNTLFTKYLNENYCFETMNAIYRNVEIIGKINTTSEAYHKYKCLRTSIGVPSCELLVPITDII